MISIEELISISESELGEYSRNINKNDLSQIVEWLEEKDNKIRYQSLLVLQNRSLYFDDVYSFWDIFKAKLKSKNSYKRNIGLMLIAYNTKWDKSSKFDDIIDEYLDLLNDEKPITIRQCIQALKYIVPYKRYLQPEIVTRLINIDILKIKETMRKPILIDILSILLMIKKYQPIDEIDDYVLHALSGEILDKKAKKQIQLML